MANLDVIEFECPRCLHRIRAASENAGQRIDCPSCQGSLLVPSKSIGQDLFDDIFESESVVSPSPDNQIDPATSESKSKDETTGVGESAGATDQGMVLNSDQDLLSGNSIHEVNSSLDDINPLTGADPFEVNPDAPLKVEGMEDIFGHADVYGIKCNICDTRIHVRPDQTNTYVECPECYSKVLVNPPESNPKAAQRWVKEGRDKKPKTKDDEDELKLSPPVEKPRIEIDKSYGFESPSEDLLAPQPKSKPIDNENNGRDAVDDPEPQSAGKTRRRTTRTHSTPNSSEASTSEKPTARPNSRNVNKTRRELYEESQRRQMAKEAGVLGVSDGELDDARRNEFPGIEIGSLFGAARVMLKSPGVPLRVLIAVGLMSAGSVATEWFHLSSLVHFAARIFFGGIPYVLGCVMLWFTSAYIYRDAALGHRQVNSWKNAGRSEVTGTFLIFSFGYFIGGLFMPPIGFFRYLIFPLRMFVAPLFLLSAWFSQSPFSIVNVDAFQNTQKESELWIEFYKCMTVLASIGLMTGLVFWVRGLIPESAFALTAILSVIEC